MRKPSTKQAKVKALSEKTDSQMLFRKVEIPESDMPIPICCPGCKKGDVVLYGYLGLPHTETWQSGKAVYGKTDYEEQKKFHVYVVDCPACMTHYVLTSNTEYELRGRVAELLEEVRVLRGEPSNIN